MAGPRARAGADHPGRARRLPRTRGLPAAQLPRAIVDRRGVRLHRPARPRPPGAALLRAAHDRGRAAGPRGRDPGAGRRPRRGDQRSRDRAAAPGAGREQGLAGRGDGAPRLPAHPAGPQDPTQGQRPLPGDHADPGPVRDHQGRREGPRAGRDAAHRPAGHRRSRAGGGAGRGHQRRPRTGHRARADPGRDRGQHRGPLLAPRRRPPRQRLARGELRAGPLPAVPGRHRLPARADRAVRHRRGRRRGRRVHPARHRPRRPRHRRRRPDDRQTRTGPRRSRRPPTTSSSRAPGWVRSWPVRVGRGESEGPGVGGPANSSGPLRPGGPTAAVGSVGAGWGGVGPRAGRTSRLLPAGPRPEGADPPRAPPSTRAPPGPPAIPGRTPISAVRCPRGGWWFRFPRSESGDPR